MKHQLVKLSLILICVLSVSNSVSCRNDIKGEQAPLIDLSMIPLAAETIQTPKKGKPSEPQDSVMICNSKSSRCYHSRYCSGLKRCTHSVVSLTKKKAESQGYAACKNCY